MDNHVLEHIGGRIRFFRKHRGMTIEELARKINKSKAAVSKYELGQIVVDVLTLHEIALVLDIRPADLLDYPAAAQAAAYPTGKVESLKKEYYLYHLQRGTVYSSVLQLGDQYVEGGRFVTLFHMVDYVENFRESDCVFQGYVYGNETVLCFILRNILYPLDKALMYFTLPLKKTDMLTGMLSGLGAGTNFPTSLKVVMTELPIAKKDKLTPLLTINPEIKKVMTRYNEFYIPIE